MITINKDFEYYLNLPLNIMGGSNMITAMDLDMDMRLGIYYLMQVYDLGFHHCVRADWEWISLSKGEDGDYLSGDEIRAMTPNKEVLDKLKEEFRRGIFPEGYKASENSQEKYTEPEFAYKGEFGWLSPTGEFTVSPWGEHEGSAHEIIVRKGFEDEYEEWWSSRDCVLGLARDFLTLVKGYVLIHNPCNDGGYIITHDNHLTKKQREFLYDYFTALGNSLRASHYIED